MTLAPRLLGLAFAAADALIELDEQGIVRFALGAGPLSSLPVAQWVGQPFSERFTPESVGILRNVLESIKPGQRSSAVAVTLDCANGTTRSARLNAFCLPELAPAISCSLSYDMQAVEVVAQRGTNNSDLPDAQSLLSHMRSKLANETSDNLQKLALAFVDVVGMENIPAGQLPEIYAGLNEALRSVSLGGDSAGRVSDSRYALIRSTDADTDIDAQIRALGAKNGVSLSSRSGETAIGMDPASTLRAMRFAIEACLRDENIVQPELHFAETLQRTLKDADHFRAVVRDRDFSLHYQPIVDIKTRAVHHFEALSRFKNATSPAPAIRMAEELALIETFDRTVAEMAVKRLSIAGSGLLSVAINVSGASLSNDAYVTALLAMTSAKPEVRKRLLIEVTETAALAEIGSANRRLNALREVGMKICIDDFGVGSASFDYLRGLNADIVKIDGSLIRDIESDPRNRTLISHLVDLGNALNLQTIGEMVETEGQAITLQTLGVNYGQGWLFGRPDPEPQTKTPKPTVARRKGVMQSWS